MKTENVILYDSPEAASIQTVTGWVASNGQFWGKDEHMARYVGSTHKVCEKNPAHGTHKNHTWCEVCQAERRQVKFDAMDRKPWDGTSPVVIFDTDTYFFDEDAVRDWLIDNDIKPEDARLVYCTPNMASEVDGDHWCDDLQEDGELSANLEAALEELNKVIRAEPPLSWSEGNTVAVLPADFLGTGVQP